MPSSTTNYGLILYDAVGDVGENFLDYRDDIAGTGTSNMVKIDTQMKVNETSASDNTSEIDTIKGVGWTTESIKGNADDIDLIEADIANNIKTHIRYFDSTGTNTYAVDTTGDFDFLDGNILYVNFTNSNTGASTISIDGTSAREVIWEDTLEDIESGVLNGYIKLVYNLSEDKLMVKRQVPSFTQLQEFRFIMGSPLDAVTGPISDNGGNALTKTGLTLQNSIVNGDFSDGTTGWLASSVSQSVSGGVNTLTSTVINSAVGVTIDNLSTDGSSTYLYYLKYKVLDSNVGNVKIRHDGSNQNIDSSPEVGKLESRVLRLTSTSAGQVGIRINSLAVGAQIEIYEMMQINLTALNKVSISDEQWLDICRQGYIDGVQSIENPVVETSTSNMADLNALEHNGNGSYNKNATSIEMIADGTSNQVFIPVKVKADTDYYVNALYAGVAGANFRVYDSAKSVQLKSESGTFNTGSNVLVYIRLAVFNFDATFSEIQFTEGTTLQDFVLFQSDQCRYPVTLGSVPSGASDKLYHSDAKVIKQKETDVHILQSGDIDSLVTSLTNFDYVTIGIDALSGCKAFVDAVQKDVLVSGFAGGEYSASAGDISARANYTITTTVGQLLILAFPKSTYPDLATAQSDLGDGTHNIRYALATPKTEPVPTSAELTIFKDGYIYNTSDTFFGELSIECPTNLAAVQKGYEYGVRANKPEVGTDWRKPEFVNNWDEYDPNLYPVRYKIDGNGVVSIKGFIAGGVDNTVIFTLPEGFRPPNLVILPAVTGGTPFDFWAVIVRPTGEVEYRGAIGASYSTLDSIRFETN